MKYNVAFYQVISTFRFCSMSLWPHAMLKRIPENSDSDSDSMPRSFAKSQNGYTRALQSSVLTDDLQLIGDSRDDFSLLSDNTLIYACIRWTEWIKWKGNVVVSKMDSVTCRQRFPILGPLNIRLMLCSNTLQGIGSVCYSWCYCDGTHRNWIWWKEKDRLFWLISVRVVMCNL